MDTLEIPISAVVGAGAFAVVLLVLVALLWRSRLRHGRRLAEVLLRLEEVPELGRRKRFDHLLGRLEEGIDRAILSRGDAAVTADRLTQALDSVPHGVVVCDDHGNVTWRNEAGRRFAEGRHADAVVERTLRELLARAANGTKATKTLELFGPPRRVLNLTAHPLEAGWRTRGAVAVVEDVSERHRVETMRRDFVANISHELKTPIGALSVLAETLADEPDPEVSQRLATRMQRESIRVARIIDDLLDLSRIEAEEAPARDAVRVSHLVGEASDRVSSLAGRKNIDIELPAVRDDLTVVCDRRQIVSAVFNLLENAVKYSGNGSTVTVSVEGDDEAVSIAVRDHGIGIPPDSIERIFERFYRVDRGRSRETGGTGLGLAIVRHVVANHGGEVRVASREGEGTLFTLRLPVGDVVPSALTVREPDPDTTAA